MDRHCKGTWIGYGLEVRVQPETALLALLLAATAREIWEMSGIASIKEELKGNKEQDDQNFLSGSCTILSSSSGASSCHPGQLNPAIRAHLGSVDDTSETQGHTLTSDQVHYPERERLSKITWLGVYENVIFLKGYFRASFSTSFKPMQSLLLGSSDDTSYTKWQLTSLFNTKRYLCKVEQNLLKDCLIGAGPSEGIRSTTICARAIPGIWRLHKRDILVVDEWSWAKSSFRRPEACSYWMLGNPWVPAMNLQEGFERSYLLKAFLSDDYLTLAEAISPPPRPASNNILSFPFQSANYLTNVEGASRAKEDQGYVNNLREAYYFFRWQHTNGWLLW